MRRPRRPTRCGARSRHDHPGNHDQRARISKPRPRRASAFTRAEAERLLATPNLIDVGMLGEAGRRARSGDRSRTAASCASADARWEPRRGRRDPHRRRARVGRGRVRMGARGRGSRRRRACRSPRSRSPISRPCLPAITWRSSALASALREGGLDAVAEVPIDGLGDTDHLVEIVRAVLHGGLGAWRATVTRAVAAERLDLIERAAILQRETSALRAFAPLPRQDPADVAVDRLRRRADGRGGAADVRRHSLHPGGLAVVRTEARAGGDRLRRQRHRRHRRRRHGRSGPAPGAGRGHRAPDPRGIRGAGAERNGRYERLS